jgi:ATP-dependent 26S proteasome regulatory subunit
VCKTVVDTPYRTAIMTTNHPERLDPALIRPGQINKKVG